MELLLDRGKYEGGKYWGDCGADLCGEGGYGAERGAERWGRVMGQNEGAMGQRGDYGLVGELWCREKGQWDREGL